MDLLHKSQKNKKRKGAPILMSVPKAAKMNEKDVPKPVESVDAPTKAPKPAVPSEDAKKKAAPTKAQHLKVARGKEGQIQLYHVDRVPGAKPQQSTVALSEGATGPSATGLQIIEKPTDNVVKKCKEFLRWFLWPLPIEDFFKDYLEKRVFLLKRSMPHYWDGWFDSEQLRDLVDAGRLHYGTDMDVTMYTQGQRFTLNMGSEEPAHPRVLWDLFEKNKCSVRVLRPQEYSSNVSRMLALLEEQFLSGFGSNAYYTPAGSQGFAPHWDDVEAFVLQVEGKKKWKIHDIGSEDELLPRFSSRNFAPDEVGEPVLEVVLEPGDMLYFPRGTIHQAQSEPDSDSFHITVSCAQKNCWADLMDIAVNAALTQAAKTMPAFRESLPRDYGNYMGVMHSDLEKDERRKAFLRTALALSEAFSGTFLPQQIDDAADKMMCRFLYDRQPPQAILSSYEQGLSEAPVNAAAPSNAMDEDSGSEEEEDALPALEKVEEANDEVTEETKIRLVSVHACRLVIEDLASLYYATENTAKYHEVDSMKVQMPLIYSEAMELLFKQHPKYVAVKDLPLETAEERLDLANELLDHQIAMVE